MSIPARGGIPAHPDAPGGPHLTVYGLVTPPFRAGDAGGTWLSQGQRAALDTLAHAIREREGLFVLTGDVGTGKTFLANRVAEVLAKVGLLVGRMSVASPGLDRADFFEAVLNAYGSRQAAHAREPFFAALGQALRRAGSRVSQAVLIIDEAQSLGDQLLHEVHALSAAAAGWPRGLAILLVGESRLSASLSEERHAPLRERVVARCGLLPFATDEVARYVEHCLAAAGATRTVFAAEALRHIASVTRGAPGAINIIADRALFLGALRRTEVISLAMVEECCRQPGLEPDVRRPRAVSSHARPRATTRRGRAYVAAIATVLLVTGAPSLAWWLAGLERAPRGSAAREPADPAPAMPDTPPSPPDEAPVGLPPTLPPQEPMSTRLAVDRPDPSDASVRRPPVPAPPIDSRAALADRGPVAMPSAMRREPAVSPERRAGVPVRVEQAPEPPRPEPSTTSRPAAPTRTQGPDPSAVIDWLIKESGQR